MKNIEPSFLDREDFTDSDNLSSTPSIWSLKKVILPKTESIRVSMLRKKL